MAFHKCAAPTQLFGERESNARPFGLGAINDANGALRDSGIVALAAFEVMAPRSVVPAILCWNV
jgi:hypothetical protein